MALEVKNIRLFELFSFFISYFVDIPAILISKVRKNFLGNEADSHSLYLN